MLHRTRSRERDLAQAAVVAWVLSSDSKLAAARRLSPETATSSLGALLGLGPVAGNEMLDMLDWLLKRQPWIERSLANRHLKDGTLILNDVSSSYLEGMVAQRRENPAFGVKHSLLSLYHREIWQRGANPPRGVMHLGIDGGSWPDRSCPTHVQKFFWTAFSRHVQFSTRCAVSGTLSSIRRGARRPCRTWPSPVPG